jgi:hypothetical protein
MTNAAKSFGSFFSRLIGGGGDTEISANISKGFQLLGQSNTPLAEQTSSVMNNQRTANVTKSASVHIGTQNIHTQAIDAQGISKGINDALQQQFKSASLQTADGIVG